MSTFEDILARDGRLVYKTKGVSMLPLLHQERDLVVIEVPKGRLSKYDVTLYKRGDNTVLHRVIHVKDDFYEIRGDNTYYLEKVPDSAILGVLTSFVRKGKRISAKTPLYLCYVRIWNFLYPVRAFYVRGRRFLGRIYRRFSK